MKAPDRVLKRLKPDQKTCTLGVILKGQFYVYKADSSRVESINASKNQQFKVGLQDYSLPTRLKIHFKIFQTIFCSTDPKMFFPLQTARQVDGNGGVTLSWTKYGLTSAWGYARLLGGWDMI